MPELPEVENVRREIEVFLPQLSAIEKCLVHNPSLRRPMNSTRLQKLVGETFKSIERRAKYLLFKTKTQCLISHLGMTGSWRRTKSTELRKHDHFELQFSGGERLIYNDPRRFGMVETVTIDKVKDYPGFENLGIEPLDRDFTGEFLFNRTRKSKAPIKTWLMNQTQVVGVGNIYASEILFEAKVKPTRATGKISKDEAQRITQFTISILEKAIESGGSTIRDYKSTNGQSGRFQNEFKVYGRKGEICKNCQSKIKLLRMAGRSTFYCSRCQR